MKNVTYQYAELILALCPRELSASELTMLELLCDAHEAAAKNNPNASNQMANFLGESGVDLKSAYIGALSIIGGKHAPVEKIRGMLRYGPRKPTGFIPGWGNSFFKDVPDPAEKEIANFIETHFPKWHAEILETTSYLHDKGKKVYPNIGCYTAVVAEIINLPMGAELALVVLPRIATWTKLYLEGKNK